MLPPVLSLHKVNLEGKHHLKEPYFKLRGVEHNDYFLNTKDSHTETL
jgi:hypothetical protein